jgi:hypothetical protein
MSVCRNADVWPTVTLTANTNATADADADADADAETTEAVLPVTTAVTTAKEVLAAALAVTSRTGTVMGNATSAVAGTAIPAPNRTMAWTGSLSAKRDTRHSAIQWYQMNKIHSDTIDFYPQT